MDLLFNLKVGYFLLQLAEAVMLEATLAPVRFFEWRALALEDAREHRLGLPLFTGSF
jgi:hypothetical protein